MPFSTGNIIPSEGLFCGLSYSDLIPIWWNYIITLKDNNPPEQMGRFLFLLGNVEGQPAPLLVPHPIEAFTYAAVFFPVLCNIVAVNDHQEEDTEIKRREQVQTWLANPQTLTAEINGFTLNVMEMSKYYVESADFMFDVLTGTDTLRTKFNPVIKPGSGRAVAGGYYLLLSPPNMRTTYNISFEGVASSGYRTKANYTVNFIT